MKKLGIVLAGLSFALMANAETYTWQSWDSAWSSDTNFTFTDEANWVEGGEGTIEFSSSDSLVFSDRANDVYRYIALTSDITLSSLTVNEDFLQFYATGGDKITLTVDSLITGAWGNHIHYYAEEADFHMQVNGDLTGYGNGISFFGASSASIAYDFSINVTGTLTVSGKQRVYFQYMDAASSIATINLSSTRTDATLSFSDVQNFTIGSFNGDSTAITYFGGTTIAASEITLTGTGSYLGTITGAVNSDGNSTIILAGTADQTFAEITDLNLVMESGSTLRLNSAYSSANSITVDGSTSITIDLTDYVSSSDPLISLAAGLIKSEDWTSGDLLNIEVINVATIGDDSVVLFTSEALSDDFDLTDFNITGEGVEASFDASGNLVITAVAVPEPSTYAMIFGTLALGLAIYRRRK